jgi:hypothetical protein
MGSAPLTAASAIARVAGIQAQPVNRLMASYSGKLTWDEPRATVRFAESGSVHFAAANARSFIWQIPPEVKQVRLARGVTVN